MAKPMRASGHLGMVVSMSAGHFGATINQDNRPIFVPCSVCQEQGKSVEAYWLNEATGARLCDEHSAGHERAAATADVAKFTCLDLPEVLPPWCQLGVKVGGLYYCSVDLADPDVREALEGEFDPAISLDDLLDSYGFMSVHLVKEAN